MELKIHGLTLSYSKRGENVLENVSLSLAKGEVGILIGRNGIGKSTLLKSLIGSIKPKEGSIEIEGKQIESYKRNELAKIVSFLPQQIILPSRLVKEEVSLGRLPFSPIFSSKEDKNIIMAAMESVGISHLANKYCNELSGGEIQKVGIARSLASQSNLVLMDEPTSNLDLKSSFSLAKTIKELSKEKGITFLISMHDIHLSSFLGDKFFFLKGKEIICSGGKETLTNENMKKTFDLDDEFILNNGGITLFDIEKDIQK